MDGMHVRQVAAGLMTSGALAAAAEVAQGARLSCK